MAHSLCSIHPAPPGTMRHLYARVGTCHATRPSSDTKPSILTPQAAASQAQGCAHWWHFCPLEARWGNGTAWAQWAGWTIWVGNSKTHFPGHGVEGARGLCVGFSQVPPMPPRRQGWRRGSAGPPTPPGQGCPLPDLSRALNPGISDAWTLVLDAVILGALILQNQQQMVLLAAIRSLSLPSHLRQSRHLSWEIPLFTISPPISITTATKESQGQTLSTPTPNGI